MKRRTFLKLAGLGSLSVAAGCTADAEKKLHTLVRAPDDMVTGAASYYATTCRECPAGCGMIAKNREGRIIKLEGNPNHPINAGSLCMRGQAALQAIYNPDRLKKPLVRKGRRLVETSFDDAQALLADRIAAATAKGPDRIRMLTETVGDSSLHLMRRVMKRWRSPAPVVFEALAYDALKAANKEVFGLEGLPGYCLDKSDVLVSFGADFLETWLSPVEYAVKFKAMHAWNKGARGLFYHVSPYQGLTAANADQWMCCAAGSEVSVVMGIIRYLMDHGRGQNLPSGLRAALLKLSESFTLAIAAERSGLAIERLALVADALLAAKQPLVLGTAHGVANGLQANMAVNLLNLVLDPALSLVDFANRHRVEIAASRADIVGFFDDLKADQAEVVLLNNANPAHTLPEGVGVGVLASERLFTVCFSNFLDETASMADLVIPTQMAQESWDEYGGRTLMVSTQQPTMGPLTQAPHVGDVLLAAAYTKRKPAENMRQWVHQRLRKQKIIADDAEWVRLIQAGGMFDDIDAGACPFPAAAFQPSPTFVDLFHNLDLPLADGLVFHAAPSIRFFDGRGANRPWLAELPDPLTQVAWQTPVILHPDTARDLKLDQGDLVRVQSKWGRVEAPVYLSAGIHPGSVMMAMGQGHTAYGQYAQNQGANPTALLSPETEHVSDGPRFTVAPASLIPTGRSMALANTDGGRYDLERKIALSIDAAVLASPAEPEKAGLTMNDFPLTLPTPEGYDPKRDFYPPHDHDQYRWGMTVDLDRCIGCSACAAACYAENNIGLVGETQIIKGREMAWLRVERYLDEADPQRITFLPMMCQHCDNAPCEAVCPVYAPHHSKEGLNNQIYNRCIGTRFCSQNCPYKVRRFNWFDWEWPSPMHLQLNPNVTVRSKGVMEKCSFCVQRIKDAHNVAKNENRMIADGEVVPACAQTCPTGAITFGSYMDPASRLRKQVGDRRAYQVMGYLNAKPAVIYLKKVVMTDA